MNGSSNRLIDYLIKKAKGDSDTFSRHKKGTFTLWGMGTTGLQ